MRLEFKIIPDTPTPQRKTPLNKGEDVEVEEEQIDKTMRVRKGRLARRLMKAVRYRAEHDNYKEIV